MNPSQQAPEPDPEGPSGPPAPGDPGTSGPFLFDSDDEQLNDQPEINCLIRQGFSKGQIVKKKTLLYGYFTLHAVSGGRIIVEAHEAKHTLRLGGNRSGKEILVETIFLRYTSYNPWDFSPIFKFSTMDSDGKKVIDEPMSTGISGACPRFDGQVLECRTIFYNELDPDIAFQLANQGSLYATKSEFRYC